MSPLTIPQAIYGIRQQALNDAVGNKGGVPPRMVEPATSIMISGTVYYIATGLAAGDVVTNILTQVTVLGSGFSGIGMKLGLYDKAGLQLAVTGDVSAAHGSTGAKTNALTAPYTAPATDAYYIALLGIATTMPTLLRGVTGTVYAIPFTGKIAPFGQQPTQTDLPSPSATITNATGAPIAYWTDWS